MKSKKNIIIFIVCYLAYTAIYIARLNLSMASPGLKDMNILDSAQIGMLGSVFSVVYAAGRLLNGTLGDKTPPWMMISTGLVIAGISNISIGFFPPFIGMFIMWGANAYAQSMLWSSVLCVISTIYNAETAKKAVSVMISSCASGSVLGILINTYIINHFGLNYAFFIPGGITLVLSTCVFFSMHKIVPEYRNTNCHIPVRKLFNDKKIKLIITPAMFHGVIKDNISLWMTVYIIDRFKVDLSSSANFVLLIPVTGFIGRMLYSFVYRLCNEQEHKVSFIFFAVCAVFSLPLVFGGFSPLISVICLSILYASVSFINTTILSIFPIGYAETGNISSVSGIMDFATYLGSGISAFIYGLIIKYTGYPFMYASWVIISLISMLITYKLMSLSRKKENF